MFKYLFFWLIESVLELDDKNIGRIWKVYKIIKEFSDVDEYL